MDETAQDTGRVALAGGSETGWHATVLRTMILGKCGQCGGDKPVSPFGVLQVLFTTSSHTHRRFFEEPAELRRAV